MTRTAKIICPNPDIERWNSKYGKPSVQHSGETRPQAEPELLAYESLLKCQGKALDVAAGRGKNALYLASIGYRVIACDLSINGLSPCGDAARKHALPVYCMICDLGSYQFPDNCFDLLVVVRYLDRLIFPELINWLKPGGLLFYKTFNRGFLKLRPEFNPDYVVEYGELQQAFSELKILASDTDQVQAALTKTREISFILAQKK